MVFKSIFILYTTLCTFNYVLSIGIFLWYHDALNWYIFFLSIGIKKVLFWFYPSLIFFLDKKGRIFFLTPLLMIDKKGEKDFEFIYAYLCFCIYWVYMRKMINDFESLNKKGRRFLKHMFVLCMFLSPSCCIHLFMHIHWKSYVYCYAWVKGELLWSLTLIHAYITPWVVSSSKRGRLLAQRPSTLVLMMINSCSYVY